MSCCYGGVVHEVVPGTESMCPPDIIEKYCACPEGNRQRARDGASPREENMSEENPTSTTDAPRNIVMDAEPGVVGQEGSALAALTQATVDIMQGEIMALLNAWVDRGISAENGAMVLAGTVHVVIARGGFPLGEFIAGVTNQWRMHGGKL